ncbi:MAG: efflux RND transporter permease subunit [Spirochaetes bacterium]|nr:efflux RND transporter permease subunit [Spirochaetota bacterium]
MNIAELAIKRPVFVVMLVASIITLGVIGYSRLPVDLLPSVEFPNILVTVPYPGASAEEVENLVAKEIESEFSTMEGIDLVRSICRENVAIVVAQFKLGVDIKFAELKSREKIQLVRPRLPSDIQEPIIRRFSLGELPIMYVALEGNRDLALMREILVDDVKPSLEQIPGVGSVEISGGRQRVVRITLDKALLSANGVTFNQISDAIRRRNVNFPVGEIKGTAKNVSVRVVGKYSTFKEIGETPVTTLSGKTVRVKDLAGVSLEIADEVTRARVGDKNAVLLLIYKQSGANTVKVAEEVRKEMAALQKKLPSDVKLSIANDSSRSIERSINGVRDDIILGAILAILVVWLFLGNFRSTIITAAALPNSLIGAFFFVFLFGFGINTMTLLALSLAIGLLIDDSIVVRENIFRYVEMGLTPRDAAIKGTNEVAMAVLSTTLAIMAVFIPISFLQGIVGQFFKQFGFTVAFGLLISLVDAFTTAPMLSAYWFKKTEKKESKGVLAFFDLINKKWNEFYAVINGIYSKLIVWALNRKRVVLIGVGGLLVFSMISCQFIGMSFFGSEDRGTFVVYLEAYPGAPLNVVDGNMKKVETFIRSHKDVETCYAIVGGEASTTGNFASHVGSIYVNLLPIHKRKLSTQDLMTRTRNFIRNEMGREVQFKMIEQGFAGGNEGAPITINISGPDLKTLEGLALSMQRILLETPGAADVDSSFRPGKPEIVVRLDAVKAEQLNISTLEVGGTLRQLMQGEPRVSRFSTGERDYDIVMRLDDKSRSSIDSLKSLMVTTRAGKKVPLAAIASFTYSSGPLEIRRENKLRLVKLSANILNGYSLSELKKTIEQRTKKEIMFPAGYKYEFVGQSQQFADLATQMVMAMLLSVVFMYMILASLYNSFIQPIYVMLTLPLAIIGAFLGLLMTGVNLNVYGFIGMLIVLGLVAKNAILLIDFANQKRETGMSVREALLAAAPIRLRPILMTTFAMIFGMLPIALGLSEGSKGRESMPVVVIGGLITSTFLTLIVIPIFYELIEGYFEKHKKMALM